MTLCVSQFPFHRSSVLIESTSRMLGEQARGKELQKLATLLAPIGSDDMTLMVSEDSRGREDVEKVSMICCIRGNDNSRVRRLEKRKLPEGDGRNSWSLPLKTARSRAVS